MKLTVLLLTIAFLNVHAGSVAQSVTLNGKNVPLKEVFSVIEKQTGYVVFYSKNLLATSRPVSISVNNMPLNDFLHVILADQPFIYQIEDKTISLSRKTTTAFGPVTNPSSPDPLTGYFLPITGVVTGPDGKPLQGINIQVRGSDAGTVTDADGRFTINTNPGSVLIITGVGFEKKEVKTGKETLLSVTLNIKSTDLDSATVSVINTGYQKVNPERFVGSYSQVDSALLHRGVSKDILSRIAYLFPGMYVNKGTIVSAASITIRGTATLNAAATPLVVVDNFPYNGDLNNLDPNDIADVTVLKDAAAASIWGARAGNGVIVITTKKGRLNQKMNVSLNANVTVVNKPDLFAARNYLNSSDYLEVEKYLFDQGYYNADLTNVRTFPVVSPGAVIMYQRKLGIIDSATAQGKLDALTGIDVRNDFLKYVYRKNINQQYSVNVNGGSNNATYAISAGYNKNIANTIKNNDDRLNLRMASTYRPIRNMDISADVNYTQNNSNSQSQPVPGSVYYNGINPLYPYARLADDNGNPLPIEMNLSQAYQDSVKKLGFLDWSYRPLDDPNTGYSKTVQKNLLFNVGLKYRITSWLNFNVQYANEFQTNISRNYQSQDSYAMRNMINKFSAYNPTTRKITYNYPLGGNLRLANNDTKGYAARAQLSFNKDFSSRHSISSIAGTEIRQRVTAGYSRLSYAYDDNFGTASNIVDYITTFTTNPSGSAKIPAPDAILTGTTQRYLSYYANVFYSYKGLYMLSASGRKDGANLFGVKTNDKITPLWSAGLGWNISKETFYHSAFLPYLKVRATYGFNGNVYSGTAYSVGSYAVRATTGATVIGPLTAPNPQLSWEKVKNVNLGFDFATVKNIFYGSLEFYIKNGQDLIQPISLAPSVGYTSFTGNAASTQTRGMELSLNSRIIDKQFKWNVFLIGNMLKDKVTRYDVPMTSSTIRNNGNLVAIKGRPLYGMYGYKWAGLDPLTGNPQGYLNGKVSQNYTSIINNFKPDSLYYAGPSRPGKWGSLRNEFSYKGLSLSVMVVYNLGYYFRRPSITGGYKDLIGSSQNTDYDQRWKKPGDELHTNVPSLSYNPASNLGVFYQYSAALIEKADHIRLQDVRLSYDLKNRLIRNKSFGSFEVYTYATNLGLLWKANKQGMDPDFGVSYPNPFSISFGVNVTFK